MASKEINVATAELMKLVKLATPHCECDPAGGFVCGRCRLYDKVLPLLPALLEFVEEVDNAYTMKPAGDMLVNVHNVRRDFMRALKELESDGGEAEGYSMVEHNFSQAEVRMMKDIEDKE